MEIKQLRKHYFRAFIIFLVAFIALRERNDNRPFKFERYTNKADFMSAVREQFPIWSDIDKAIEVLGSSGVQKIEIDKVQNYLIEGTKPEAEYIICFRYYAPVVSLNPDALYRIYFEIDKYRRIIKIGGSRSSWNDGVRW